MSSKFSHINEKLFFSKEISSIGTAGTVKLLRGKAARLLNFIGRSLSYSSTRSYGSFMLSFGLVSLLLNFGEYYFMDEPEVSAQTLITCMVVAALSIPLLIFDKPICIAAQDLPLTDHLLFEFFAIKRMHRGVEHPSIPPLAALFLGFIPATLGFFLPIWWVILGLFLIVVVTVAFTSPEFPMILTLLSLPYISAFPHSTVIISVMSIICFLAYALKVMVGKRVFHFDLYDVIILLAMTVVFISGTVGLGDNSLINALLFISLMLGYFPATNIIVNRRLADSAIKSVIVSAVPIAVISIIEFIVELPSTSYEAPSYSTPGTSALFSTPMALAAFLLVCAILTLVFASEKKNKLSRSVYFFIFTMELGVLGLIMQPEAWVSALVALLAYPILKSRKIPLDVLVILIAIPYLIFLLPNTFLDTVSDYFDLSMSYSAKLGAFRRAFGVFVDNIWLGIGNGEGAYMKAVGRVKDGTFNALLGISVEFGIFLLILIVFMIILWLRQLSYYRLYVRNSLVCTTGDMAALAIIALLALGAFDYIFSDVSVFYLFWSVFAISTASLRTAKKEHDDRLGYYSDSRSSESSALDIGINK